MLFNSNTLFLELDLPHLKHVTLRHCFRFFKREEKITASPGKEFLGFYLQLGNDLRYKIDTKTRVIVKGQYNLVYLPERCCELTLGQGNFSSFSIGVNADYLRPFMDTFPLLAVFLLRVELKIPAVLGHTHLQIPEEISKIVQEVIENKYSPDMLEIILKAKFFDIILSCLEQSHKSYPGQVPVQKIIEIREYILKNLQRQFSVGFLADTFDIEKRKLLAGFKVLFGTTVYKFITDTRMKSALSLLRDTDMPIGKIAMKLGYKNIRAFSYAFLSKYGYSHTTMRTTSGSGKIKKVITDQ